MVCPVCPAIGAVGGYIGGYIGIDPPSELKYRVLSGFITAGLLVITIVALRCFLGIAICDGNGIFSLRNIVQVGLISVVLGVIYSIGVNFFINLATPQSVPIPSSPCCCEGSL